MLPSDAATKKRRSRNLSASPYANLHVRRGECARLSLLERLRNSLRTTPRTLAIIALQTLTRTFPADAATKKLRSQQSLRKLLRDSARPTRRMCATIAPRTITQLRPYNSANVSDYRSSTPYADVPGRRGDNKTAFAQSLLEPLRESARPARRMFATIALRTIRQLRTFDAPRKSTALAAISSRTPMRLRPADAATKKRRSRASLSDVSATFFVFTTTIQSSLRRPPLFTSIWRATLFPSEIAALFKMGDAAANARSSGNETLGLPKLGLSARSAVAAP